MTGFKDKPSWLIIGLLVAVIFGQGGYWKWRELRMDKVVKVMDFRREENAIYQRMIDLSDQYVRATEEYSKTQEPPVRNKIEHLKVQLGLEKSNFVILESQLAQLESRPPRKIPLDFVVPGPPTRLQVIP